MELETELFNLGDFIDDIVEEVLTTKKRGQEVFAANQGDAFVQLDMKKLRYILVNLLSNAVKYSPEEANISVNSQVTQEYVTLSVQDNGIGIPEEEQKFMFRKFFRAKNTGNIQGDGSWSYHCQALCRTYGRLNFILECAWRRHNFHGYTSCL